MRIRTLFVAVAIAIVGIVPLAGPAHATHNCGFEPCPHPEDVTEFLCYKYPVLDKLPLNLCS